MPSYLSPGTDDIQVQASTQFPPMSEPLKRFRCLCLCNFLDAVCSPLQSHPPRTAPSSDLVCHGSELGRAHLLAWPVRPSATSHSRDGVPAHHRNPRRDRVGQNKPAHVDLRQRPTGPAPRLIPVAGSRAQMRPHGVRRVRRGRSPFTSSCFHSASSPSVDGDRDAGSSLQRGNLPLDALLQSLFSGSGRLSLYCVSAWRHRR